MTSTNEDNIIISMGSFDMTQEDRHPLQVNNISIEFS